MQDNTLQYNTIEYKLRQGNILQHSDKKNKTIRYNATQNKPRQVHDTRIQDNTT